MKKRVHFIAIGGSAMHNLAIALKLKGYDVSGSDDEIFDPAKSRLEKYGILPEKIGWQEDNISEEIDEVILGMHARIDNPELLKAQKLGLKIYSYPEYLYEQSKDKTRVVVGGSHGKTSITAMILHVLGKLKMDCDYMVGAKLDGFEVMVKLSNQAQFMIIEGDEYLTSPIDRRPKFHLYKPHIAIISGIAWDHINVFPTFENYVEQFQIFADLIEKDGHLIYYDLDDNINNIASNSRQDIHKHPYHKLDHYIDEAGTTHITHKNTDTAIKVFGDHNLSNIHAAKLACNALGIDTDTFNKSIADFPGASNRLELIGENSGTKVFKDFAHSPSKLKATTQAVKSQFGTRKLIAVMELHTFSSLNIKFLQQYSGSMNQADVAVVYYNQHSLAHKKLPPLNIDEVKAAFGRSDLKVFNDTDQLFDFIESQNYQDSNLLLMSSGNFEGKNLKQLAKNICKL